MLVTFGICFKQHFDTRYLVFYNPSPPRMFLSLDLLSEYRIQHGANGPLYVTSSYWTWIFCRGVSGFATDCPCGVWCRGLTTCLLHAGPPGLGRVPDLRVRVQVRVLVICVSPSMSWSTWLLHEYEYEYKYWLMSMSTSKSTGIWSTFYINSSIAFFSLWTGNPQILTNLRQSYNFPLSLQIPFVNIYLFNCSI